MGGGLVLVLVASRLFWDYVMPRGSSYPHEDKHQAPASTPPHPLSLQDVGPLAAPFLLHSVRKNHQDGWDTIYLIPNNIF